MIAKLVKPVVFHHFNTDKNAADSYSDMVELPIGYELNTDYLMFFDKDGSELSKEYHVYADYLEYSVPNDGECSFSADCVKFTL